jgi:hypothetical protein
MSTPTELLRRTLEALEGMRLMDLFRVDAATLPEDIRAYLAAEKESEPMSEAGADEQNLIDTFQQMKGDFDICIDGEIPEALSLRFTTNGVQGGDAGHGGYAHFVLWQDGGESSVVIGNGYECNEYENCDFSFKGNAIDFRVEGDWEIGGMIRALINMGSALSKRYDYLNPSESIKNQEVDRTRKPMTDVDIDKGIDTGACSDEEVYFFAAGARWAEKHHGIGGGE